MGERLLHESDQATQLLGSLPTKKALVTPGGFTCRARIKDEEYFLNSIIEIADGNIDPVVRVNLCALLMDEIEAAELNNEESAATLLRTIKSHIIRRAR